MLSIVHLPLCSYQRSLLASLLASVIVACTPPCADAATVSDLARDLKELQSGDGNSTIYFGNGCFWGRQKDFIETERKLGRADDQLSALVGYAGVFDGSLPPVPVHRQRICAARLQAARMVPQMARCATTTGPRRRCMRSWGMPR